MAAEFATLASLAISGKASKEEPLAEAAFSARSRIGERLCPCMLCRQGAASSRQCCEAFLQKCCSEGSIQLSPLTQKSQLKATTMI